MPHYYIRNRQTPAAVYLPRRLYTSDKCFASPLTHAAAAKYTYRHARLTRYLRE